MLLHSNTSFTPTPTPGSSSSTSNTLEPVTTSTNSSSSQLNQHLQQPSASSFSLQQPQQMKQMGCTSTLNSRPPSRAPSILDSPTLARVERARLRLEASAQLQNLNDSCGSIINTLNGEDSLESVIMDPSKKDVPWHQIWTHMKRLSHASKTNSSTKLSTPKADTSAMVGKSILFPDKSSSLKDTSGIHQVFTRPDMQSLLAGRVPVSSMTGPIKRGLLWQQRDRLFSRWKERYFILTRDYLHCFKRASGSANERASDMGQFIFKVKLVDVEKVEWLNRRSYSAIGLLLGREGRVLLRCDEGLEDWFELLEECTITSKERRKALKIAQGPRSRASLAAPVSHASLQSNHFGLGSTYSSALDEWLMTNGSGMGASRNQKFITNSMCGFGGNNPFLLSDSVPDLSALNNENHNYISGMSTNHSTPQKIPYSSSSNNSRYSNGYKSQNNSFSNSNGLYGSPRRICINNSFVSNHVVDEEIEDNEVELRRPRIFRHLSTENGNELDREWLYRKPKAPTDMRHSVQPMLSTHNNTSLNKLITDLDYSAHDSGLDTPPSTHRPSSYREQTQNNHARVLARDSTETSTSSRGTVRNSPGGSFRGKHVQQISNMNHVSVLPGSRYSVQERALKIRNEEEHCNPTNLSNRINHNELCDPNQNRYYKNGNQSPITMTPQHTPVKMQHINSNNYQTNDNVNGNSNSANNNNNNIINSNVQNNSGIFRERYQHPALAAIINEAQGMKFRDRSYSDCQKMPPKRSTNNNSSPLSSRRNHINPIFGTPTRV